MKMKKTLFGVFLGILALAWVEILPDFVSAEDPNESSVKPVQGQVADGSYGGNAWWGDYWDWANPDPELAVSSCGWSAQCLTGTSLSHTLLNAFLRRCGFSIFLYVLFLIEYFIIYKHKKDPSPLKHAFKSTWWLGIMIFILFPIMFIIIFWIING